ncbi:MAG: ribonuclease R [Clostridia bacterium]|nr:ribonuclease R [Clostridia bacterium]
MKKKKQTKKNNNVKSNLQIGTFIANEKGFGFIEIEGEAEDIFVAPEYVKSAMNGDIVSFRVIEAPKDGMRAEGKIVDVLKRNVKVVVGTYQKSKNFGFVVVDDSKIEDIYIPKNLRGKAKNNDKVVVQIVKYPENNKSAEGKIIEILGKADDTNVDLISVLRMYDLKQTFPKVVQTEVKDIPQVIHGIDGRVDLRDKEIFTIDGADTKDIDDAISLSKNGDNYLLGVHIADVSTYVRENTPLDKEASKRGTSVYLIDTVIPMLPKELSNGICSLNPNVDRYALSIDMEIDKYGNVINKKIYKSVICSKMQMTYDNVYKVVEEDEVPAGYEKFKNTLLLMKELALILINKRKSKGAIDFEIPEAKILLDENDKVIEIKPRENTIANRIIEQFMVLANECIAEFFHSKEIPFIYRIHETPDEDKIEKLKIFLNNINYVVDFAEEVTPKDLQRIVEKYKGKEEEKVVSTTILRTMRLAKYSNENIGHFGLALKDYCHFTSPIRRYPDLFIHRVISNYLDKKIDEKKKAKFAKLAIKFADMSSDAEKKAEEAERELEKIKMCEYMSEHIDEEFDGIISSVTSFGVFVELENTIEGLVHVENMKDDYYIFDEKNVIMTGKHSKRVLKIGDKVKIKVIAADKMLRRIDFEIS